MRLPLIDGQGNFGSMDGDPPAAKRYTEARLARVADALLDDLDKDTVDFQPNYDDTEREPKVLPAGFPNLLVNGAQGIAVGMATNIPPHNLGEVIDACCAYLDNRAITVEELMEHRAGAGFPDRRHHHRPRRHARRLQDRPRRGDPAREEPYRGDPQGPRGDRLHRDPLSGQQVEAGRAHRRDGAREADRGHLRSARRKRPRRRARRRRAEARREPDIVLNQLYRHTALQTSFGVNMLALNGGRPELLTLRDIIVAFVAFREEVVTRRTIYLLGKARERAHILLGLAVAVANIDEIIALIRAAPDPATARAGLIGRAWPAADVAPLIALVGEPGRGSPRTAPTGSPTSRRGRSSICACSA